MEICSPGHYHLNALSLGSDHSLMSPATTDASQPIPKILAWIGLCQIQFLKGGRETNDVKGLTSSARKLYWPGAQKELN